MLSKLKNNYIFIILILINPIILNAQTLLVSPTQFNLTVVVKQNVPTQTVKITKSGSGAVRWTVTKPQVIWLSVTPEKGVNSGSLILTFQTTNLNTGDYSTNLIITSNSGNKTIPIQVRVEPDRIDPIPVSKYGPSSSITCPLNSINITPGSSIQDAINSSIGTTTFCLKAGTFFITAAITPKTGNTFVGEFGAIIDGTNWVPPTLYEGAFRAHNQEISDVTIRNLIIQNVKTKAVHVLGPSYRWIVEYCEVKNNYAGLMVSNDGRIRNNYIHHNTQIPTSPIPGERGGGYSSYRTTGGVFENNEIAYNGPEQKVLITTNLVFRGNFVHHNFKDGIWYDADNNGILVENNVIEDNGRDGVSQEIGGTGIVRNNVIKRNAGGGIFISTSSGIEAHNNLLEGNFRGVQFFLDCPRRTAESKPFDLANNNVHDNTIITTGTAWASSFTYTNCTQEDLIPYANGSKNNWFKTNSYTVPDILGRYWVWSYINKTWSEWRAVGQDILGSVK